LAAYRATVQTVKAGVALHWPDCSAETLDWATVKPFAPTKHTFANRY